jgi:hypothetical protein
VSGGLGPGGERAGEFWLWVAVGAFALAMALLGGASAWARWGRPGAPEIKMGWSSVRDETPAGIPCGRALLVRRTITSDRTADGMMQTWLERRADPGPDPDPGVVVGPLRVAVSREDITVHEGAHLRQRLWDIPCSVRPGEYVYRSQITFCRGERCETLPLPAVPIVLR